MLLPTNNASGTLEPLDELMESEASQLENQPQRGGPLKFSYANGARPLAGYTIKRGIGRGGFGEVYFAVSDGGKEVAIKLIRHNLDVEIRGVTHCLNLKHPNLIALYDVKLDDQDNSWVVMEYATGESLEEVIRRYPRGLPLAEAMDWMQGIAAGVGYLHDHGIVHRDLKPGNIFLDDGQVKLGDYGLSKFISCSRRSGQTESIGTVHYMAPEVANGRYGKEIDIYALGIILYEVLTGHVPFEGESVGEILMKHLTAEPSLAEVPGGYREVIGRALAKDPSWRFASVGEMMSALPPLPAGAAPQSSLGETRLAGDPQPAAAGWVPPTPPPGPQPVYAAVGTPPPVSAPVDEEPIWKAIREGWRTTRDSWDSFNTPTKIILLVIVTTALANNGWLLEYGPVLVVLYLVYRVARSVVLQNQARQRAAMDPRQAATAETQHYPYRPVAAPAAPQYTPPNTQGTIYRGPSDPVAPGDWRKASRKHWKHHKQNRRWREQAAQALVVKPVRERMADLAGSMILAAIIGAVMSIVVVLLRGDAEVKTEEYAWLTLVSVLGAWAVLIPAKFWEGTKGDAVVRRIVQMVVGLILGAIAYQVAELLLIKFPNFAPSGVFSRRSGLIPNVNGSYDIKDGSPLLITYLAYFGALFTIISWWKQANPLRSSRLSIWCTMVCVFWAWVINFLWLFPQPWGLMVAAIISISVQLSSPFLPQQARVTQPA